MSIQWVETDRTREDAMTKAIQPVLIIGGTGKTGRRVAEKLEAIRRAVLDRDADGLRRASHTLLGSCTTLGAVGMAGLVAAGRRRRN